MNAPRQLKREWSLREIDIVKKTLDDRHRHNLAKMIERVTLTIDFDDDIVQRLNDAENDTDEDYELWMYSKVAYEELVSALRKSIERYNDELIKRANATSKHSLHILTRERTILRKSTPRQPITMPADDDTRSIASRTTTRTMRTAPTVTPMQMWIAGVRRRRN